MKLISILGTVLLVATFSSYATGDPCSSLASDLETTDQEAFIRALQAVLDHDCTQLLPRVAELFITRAAPAPFYAADVLALSGQKEYGPVVITEYFKLSCARGVPPSSLRDEVVLACSDLPRGKDLYKVAEYATKEAPALDQACLEKYRRLLEGHYGEPDIPYFAMDLLQETSTPEALDIISRCLESKYYNVRSEAVIALQHIPLDISLGLLSKAAVDPDEIIRYQALRLLSMHRDARVEALFRRRLGVETAPHLSKIIRRYIGNE